MCSNNRKAPPDGGYGWVIVVCFIFINSCLLPLVQCFGIIYENRFQRMNITAAEISFLLHLNNAAMCSVGFLSGPLLKRFDFRQVSFMGSGLYCIGIFLTTFAKSYTVLICTIGIIIGVGQGILMPGMYIAVNTYFKKRLTLAVSLQVTGASLSQIFMPQVCSYFLKTYGVEGTVLLLSGISLNALPVVVLLRPMPEEKRPTLLEEELPDTEKRPGRLDGIIKMLDLELFSDRVYVIIVIGMGISFASELNVVLMTPFILAELANFDNKNVATAISVQATADVIGRALLPYIFYRIGVGGKVMYMSSLVIASIGRTMLATCYTKPALVFLVAATIGLSKGIRAVYQSVIIPKIVTREKLAAATGLAMVVNGIMSLTIGPLIGVTHDVGKSYLYTLHTATLLSMLCILLWSIDYVLTVYKKKPSIPDESAINAH